MFGDPWEPAFWEDPKTTLEYVTMKERVDDVFRIMQAWEITENDYDVLVWVEQLQKKLDS